jgi:hypothetical protein
VAQQTESTLIDPDWEDPFFADYIAQNRAGFARESAAVSFSLPVLGFLPAGDVTENAAFAAVDLNLAGTVSGWPECAAESPEITTVPQTPEQAAGLEPGTWFTSTYDFGCLQVIIEGDRNRPDPALVPQPDALPESGTVEITVFDENAGAVLDAEGRATDSGAQLSEPASEPLINYTRGNIVYTITVSCAPESRSFCNNNGALRDLSGQLVPVAGHPTP